MAVCFLTPKMKTHTDEQLKQIFKDEYETMDKGQIALLKQSFRFIAEGVALSTLNAHHDLLVPATNVSYGVADNPLQVLERDEYIVEDTDDILPVVVFLTPIHKEDESERYGWRWHKWGKYIGDQIPTCEYLYDEKEIDLIYVYKVYKLNPVIYPINTKSLEQVKVDLVDFKLEDVEV